MTYLFGLSFLDPQSVGDYFTSEIAEITYVGMKNLRNLFNRNAYR